MKKETEKEDAGSKLKTLVLGVPSFSSPNSLHLGWHGRSEVAYFLLGKAIPFLMNSS